jgi:hypothetical protein
MKVMLIQIGVMNLTWKVIMISQFKANHLQSQAFCGDMYYGSLNQLVMEYGPKQITNLMCQD